MLLTTQGLRRCFNTVFNYVEYYFRVVVYNNTEVDNLKVTLTNFGVENNLGFALVLRAPAKSPSCLQLVL